MPCKTQKEEQKNEDGIKFTHKPQKRVFKLPKPDDEGLKRVLLNAQREKDRVRFELAKFFELKYKPSLIQSFDEILRYSSEAKENKEHFRNAFYKWKEKLELEGLNEEEDEEEKFFPSFCAGEQKKEGGNDAHYLVEYFASGMSENFSFKVVGPSNEWVDAKVESLITRGERRQTNERG